MEDQPVFVALGASTVAAARGPVSIYRRAGILGYRIYRTGEDGVPVLAGEVGARVARFDDSGVENNVLFVYEVRSFDQGHEVGPRLEPGSTEDMARRAKAIDNLAQPVDAAGEPIRGWFNRTDNKDWTISSFLPTTLESSTGNSTSLTNSTSMGISGSISTTSSYSQTISAGPSRTLIRSAATTTDDSPHN